MNILSDENLKDVLSFCDFHTLVKTRKASRKLRHLSDLVLDQWVENVAHKLPIEFEDCDSDGESGIEIGLTSRFYHWLH